MRVDKRHTNQEKYKGQIFILVERNNYVYVVPAFISDSGLEGIKLKAVEEGIPYQTLVASIIHKYVTGRLTEKQAQ